MPVSVSAIVKAFEFDVSVSATFTVDEEDITLLHCAFETRYGELTFDGLLRYDYINITPTNIGANYEFGLCLTKIDHVLIRPKGEEVRAPIHRDEDHEKWGKSETQLVFRLEIGTDMWLYKNGPLLTEIAPSLAEAAKLSRQREQKHVAKVAHKNYLRLKDALDELELFDDKIAKYMQGEK